MKFSEIYSRKGKKQAIEACLPSSSAANTETRIIPFTQLPTVAAEVKAQGKIIVAMQWDRNTYTVTIRNS